MKFTKLIFQAYHKKVADFYKSIRVGVIDDIDDKLSYANTAAEESEESGDEETTKLNMQAVVRLEKTLKDVKNNFSYAQFAKQLTHFVNEAIRRRAEKSLLDNVNVVDELLVAVQDYAELSDEADDESNIVNSIFSSLEATMSFESYVQEYYETKHTLHFHQGADAEHMLKQAYEGVVENIDDEMNKAISSIFEQSDEADDELFTSATTQLIRICDSLKLKHAKRYITSNVDSSRSYDSYVDFFKLVEKNVRVLISDFVQQDVPDYTELGLTGRKNVEIANIIAGKSSWLYSVAIDIINRNRVNGLNARRVLGRYMFYVAKQMIEYVLQYIDYTKMGNFAKFKENVSEAITTYWFDHKSDIIKTYNEICKEYADELKRK
jgi:predicted transcriptional regulator